MVLSLVERDGHIRSMYVDDRNVRVALNEHLDERCRLVTDRSSVYKTAMPFAHQHESIDHSKYEWRAATSTRTLEGFFSIFRRGLVGVYQHLDRYLAEFDFRKSTRVKLGIYDVQRTGIAVARGKRLQYKTAH